jgi:hypothetical protein
MQGDDLGVFGILWGTAIAFALAAVTMVDSGRKRVLAGLWVAAVVFLAAALLWPWISEKWPEAKAIGQFVSGNQLALDVVGLAIFGLLVWDFLTRRRWLTRDGGGSIAQALESKIEQLKGRVSAVEETRGNTRDILILTNFAVYQSTLQMLNDLLKDAPPVNEFDAPLQLGGDFTNENATAITFLDLVRRKLDPGSWRRTNFENSMLQAASSAEYEVEQTPVEQRPTGIDPLALRKWAIVNRQCSRAVAFLKHEKKEAEQNLLQQRHNLLEICCPK